MPYPNSLIMTNSELYRFTCQCLSLDDHPEFITKIISNLSNDENRRDFVRFCSNYWVLPAIYVKFRSHNILIHLSEEFTEFLAEVHQLNLYRNEQILKQLQEIMNILNKEEIYPTLLKGAGNLLDNLYSDTGERMMGDIDFLVPEKEYLLSAELMQNAGYLKFEDISEYEDILSMKHYPRLYHPDFTGVVEIHRIPVNQEYLGWFNQELINSQRRTVSSLKGCYVQSDNHKIIHNFIHSQLSNEGFLFGSITLRDIYDLYLFSKRTPLKETLPQIKESQKAIAYYAFARNAFSLNENFFDGENFAHKILNKKHNLKMNSPFFYDVLRSTIFIYQRVFIGYIGQLFKALYSKKKQQYLIKRIRDRNWYNHHFNLYTRFFKKKK